MAPGPCSGSTLKHARPLSTACSATNVACTYDLLGRRLSTTSYNAANKYVPQTVVADAGTGTLTFGRCIRRDAAPWHFW